MLVERVRAAINLRFPGQLKPRVLFVDRGAGFYFARTGKATAGFGAALREHNLRDYMDGDAAEQPGALQDVLLHETAVSWVRNSLKTSLPQKPWEESREAFGARLRDAAREANTKYDVDGLCREFPSRIADLKARSGDRLGK